MPAPSLVSPIMSLPLMAPAQAAKHITLNEALLRLEALSQLVVSGVDLLLPPENPSLGDAVLIGDLPMGLFADHVGEIAIFTDGGWRFVIPRAGWQAWDIDTSRQLRFHDGLWVHEVKYFMDESVTFTHLGIGTSPAPDHALTVAGASALFHSLEPGGDIRLSLSRNAPDATASILFQDAFSGRAEIGLCDDNNLSVRLSNDGSAFETALSISPDTGNLGVGRSPGSFRLEVDDSKPDAGGFAVSNQSDDPAASTVLRLEAGNNHFFQFQLYSSGVLYAFTEAAMVFGTYAPKGLYFMTDTQTRLSIDPSGKISTGDAVASAAFNVDGAVRVGAETISNLPSAISEGAGSIRFAVTCRHS